jgi:UDP-3-O-[3-hydroxymyristoyl] glucosamine N-acyltransferase
VKLHEIARIVHGKIYGQKNFVIDKILPPDDAGKHDLTFIFGTLVKTKAGAIISNEKVKKKNGIIVTNPKKAMYELLKTLSKTNKKKSVSPLSLIESNITLPRYCVIEPFAVLKKGVDIGSRTYIGSHCFIDEGVIIGKNCEIQPNTIIYKNTKIGNYVVIHANTVIGKQGFGYIKEKRYKRLKHIGGVSVQDFVEIGSNVTVDRGTIGLTVIGKGTKIDNLVHIAHNVKIGKNCIIMGQTGIAGSSKIGNNVTLCGQVGIKDHVEIGNNIIVYAKSGVFTHLSSNKEYSGIPAREHRLALKAMARLYTKI